MSQDKLRLLCGGTQKSDGGDMKGNRSLGWEISDVLWNTDQTPPAVVRTVQANERALAANNRLKGHPLPPPPCCNTRNRPLSRKTKTGFCACAITLWTISYLQYTYGSNSFVFVLLRDFQDNFDVPSVVNQQICSGMCCRVVWYVVTILRRNCMSSYPRTHRSSEY
jgi:hypothetical protein